MDTKPTSIARNMAPRLLLDLRFEEVDKNIEVFINPIDKTIRANYRSEDAADEVERKLTAREIDTIIALGKTFEAARSQ